MIAALQPATLTDPRAVAIVDRAERLALTPAEVIADFKAWAAGNPGREKFADRVIYTIKAVEAAQETR